MTNNSDCSDYTTLQACRLRVRSSKLLDDLAEHVMGLSATELDPDQACYLFWLGVKYLAVADLVTRGLEPDPYPLRSQAAAVLSDNSANRALVGDYLTLYRLYADGALDD